MPQMSFRPATEEDLPKILEIEKIAQKLPWTETHFREEMAKPFAQFLVLTDDDTDSVIGGYIVYWAMFDECHILTIATNPEWRGLGLGKKLVRQVINYAVSKDMKRLFLEVRKSNEAAIKLYSSLGFFVDHIKKNFYEDGEDAYFMELFVQKKSSF